MKRIIILSLIASTSVCAEIYDTFKHCIPKEFARYQYNGGALNLPLEPDSEELHAAIQLAKRNGVTPRLHMKTYYTPKELENVEYFNMEIPSPLELEGKNAASYGTKYTGGCPHCGTGGIPVGDVLVDRKFIRSCRIGTLEPDIFVNKEIKELLECHEFTGISFDHRLRDYRGREMDDYYIMTIHSILPPLSKTTWLRPDRRLNQDCAHQITYVDSDFQYESETFADVADFNLTKEYLNNWMMRSIVVSANVRNVFKKNKIRAHFEPITLL